MPDSRRFCDDEPRCGRPHHLRAKFASEQYRRDYEKWRAEFDAADPSDDATWLNQRLMPDPDMARVRVYATHSTHKTLTAFRQGSMIHVHDQDFEHHARNSFNEAYMTHTSTSPNYQILASLDVGRRQVELEGHEMVARSIELAMMLRERIDSDPLIGKYFDVLAPENMILEPYRPSGLKEYFSKSDGWGRMDTAWLSDEFVLDPTRVTLHVGRTGLDGDTFKKLLMDKFDLQINKTSRNTVLFMIHIGMTRGTIAHLVNVLTQIARDLDDKLDRWSDVELASHDRQSSFAERRPSAAAQLQPFSSGVSPHPGLHDTRRRSTPRFLPGLRRHRLAITSNSKTARCCGRSKQEKNSYRPRSLRLIHQVFRSSFRARSSRARSFSF